MKTKISILCYCEKCKHKTIFNLNFVEQHLKFVEQQKTKTDNLHNLLLFCKENALQPHTLSPDLVELAIEELKAMETE